MHVLSTDGVCWYRGDFIAKYFYFFGLEPAHDLFSAAVKCTLLGRIRIFLQFFVPFCFVLFFNFLCGEISKWIKKDPRKVEFSLLSWFCFCHVLCMVFIDTWHQRCRVAPLYAKQFDFDKNTWFCGTVCARSSICSRKETRQAQARADLKFPVCFPGAGTGWCEVRAQWEIKLLWTELSRELSSWISSCSSREAQRVIPGRPSLLEQPQLGDGKESGVAAAAASQLCDGEEEVPDPQRMVRVLLQNVSCRQ